MNRKLDDILVFGLADHPYGHPPYENNNDEGAICRIIGGFGCGVGVLFYGEFAAVGGAGDAAGAAVSYRCMGSFARSYALRLDIAARGR